LARRRLRPKPRRHRGERRADDDGASTSSLCIALSRLDGADQRGVGRALRHALRGMLTNPLP
jgi:hypothetical protein